MITNAKYAYEYRGLSTDNKMLIANAFENGKIPNGAVFFCIDTQDIYMYDAENNTWKLL